MKRIIMDFITGAVAATFSALTCMRKKNRKKRYLVSVGTASKHDR